MDMEEGYRRGTVLGLTVAEIFVLLVFLMLLALLGVNRYWSGIVDPWGSIMEARTPEEVEQALEMTNELPLDIERLKRRIEELRKKRERLREQIRTLIAEEGMTEKELGEARRRLEESKKELEEARRKIETLTSENQKELGEARRRLEESKKELEEARRKIETLTSENQMVQPTNSELQKKIDDLEEQLRLVGKGTTPPCWYQIVEERNPITKANWRERAYYLFDIVIREDHMEVQPVPIPEGGAEDDGGESYAEEAKLLNLEDIPYGRPLSDDEVREVMRHLHEKGKASQVRTYSCVFYVRVWDDVPDTAKDRWKRAHDGVLEQLFGTYDVQDFSWHERARNRANVPR